MKLILIIAVMFCSIGGANAAAGPIPLTAVWALLGTDDGGLVHTNTSQAAPIPAKVNPIYEFRQQDQGMMEKKYAEYKKLCEPVFAVVPGTITHLKGKIKGIVVQNSDGFYGQEKAEITLEKLYTNDSKAYIAKYKAYGHSVKLQIGYEVFEGVTNMKERAINVYARGSSSASTFAYVVQKGNTLLLDITWEDSDGNIRHGYGVFDADKQD